MTLDLVKRLVAEIDGLAILSPTLGKIPVMNFLCGSRIRGSIAEEITARLLGAELMLDESSGTPDFICNGIPVQMKVLRHRAKIDLKSECYGQMVFIIWYNYDNVATHYTWQMAEHFNNNGRLSEKHVQKNPLT